ncbi:MAG: hypothetical protein U0736_03615 [Gemmataceae bacterium]
MAFNPFTWFRKHQKVMFAGLTILVMFVFIGQFGRGDIFERALYWFGAGRAGGPVVTKLFGKGVHSRELDLLGRQRKLASDYLHQIALTKHPDVINKFLNDELKATTSSDNPLAGLREICMDYNEVRKAFVFYAQSAQLTPEMRYALFQQIRDRMESGLRKLRDIALRPEVMKDPARLTLLQNVATVLGFQAWLCTPQATPQMYFGGTIQNQDLLDFKVWQHHADRLGIKLTEDDVLRELTVEAAGAKLFAKDNVRFEQQKEIDTFLRGNRDNANLTGRDLLNALREEFRVVFTYGILIGQEPGVRLYRSILGANTTPVYGTPDQFYNFVREQRTALKVDLLTVPVDNYLDRVKEMPSEAELRQLYERRKDVEPNATAREPGFKEPRRIRVQYVVGSPEDAFYREAAEKQVKQIERLSEPKVRVGTVLATLTAPVLGRLLAAYDPIQAEFEKVRENDYPWFTSSRDNFRVQEERQRRVHLTSLLNPVVAAATQASLAGGNALTGLLSAATTAVGQEVRTSLQFNAGMLLAQAQPSQLFGAAALAVKTMPDPVSRELVASDLVAGLRTQIAQKVLDDNLQTIRTELAKLKNQPSKAAEYVAGAVKEYHLTQHQMPAARTRETLVEEVKKKAAPALAALREAMGQRDGQDRPANFVDQLFQGSAAYEAQQVTATRPRREELLYWRSEDLPARLRDYADIRDEVAKAWRLAAARRLARHEAERLETEINNKKLNAADAVRLLREQKQGPLFELDNVAQLLPPKEVLPGRQTEYQAYQLPEDRFDQFAYPPADLAKRLLEMKRTGEATVIADQAARNYYVAVLRERNEPNIADFRSIYGSTPERDTLYSLFLAERRQDFGQGDGSAPP